MSEAPTNAGDDCIPDAPSGSATWPPVCSPGGMATVQSRCSPAVAGAIAALCLLSGATQDKGPSEYEVKAAYVLNFARFAEWPAESFENDSAPVILGILGRDPFGSLLDRTLANQKIGKRGIEIRRGARLQDLGTCHLLFISETETERVEQAIAGARVQGVLTISEFENFAALGGAIGFYAEEKRIRFEVNLRACEKNGIKLSSKLLKLARIVKDR